MKEGVQSEPGLGQTGGLQQRGTHFAFQVALVKHWCVEHTYSTQYCAKECGTLCDSVSCTSSLCAEHAGTLMAC